MKNEKSGVDISVGIDKLAIMGFLEVLMNLRRILSYFRKAKSEILQFQPDALILIDYPGFNMRMAEWAKSEDLRFIIILRLWFGHGERKGYRRLKHILINCL